MASAGLAADLRDTVDGASGGHDEEGQVEISGGEAEALFGMGAEAVEEVGVLAQHLVEDEARRLLNQWQGR